jgi:hypothetical protein
MTRVQLSHNVIWWSSLASCDVPCRIYNQNFIASYLFFTNFKCNHRLWSPKFSIRTLNMLSTIFTKMKICLTKFFLPKWNSCIIFLHSLGTFSKCTIYSFPRLPKLDGCIFFHNLGIFSKCIVCSFPRLQIMQFFKIFKKKHVYGEFNDSTNFFSNKSVPNFSLIGSMQWTK